MIDEITVYYDNKVELKLSLRLLKMKDTIPPRSMGHILSRKGPVFQLKLFGLIWFELPGSTFEMSAVAITGLKVLVCKT